MAIEERKTKAERREEARLRRKAEEAQEQKQTTRRNVTTGVGAFVLIVLVGLGVYFAADNSGVVGDNPDADRTITREAALDARGAAECETLVDEQPLEDRAHHEISAAPPADVMYGNSPVRPTTSGPHFAGFGQPLGGIPREPIDERSVTHNMEHGSLVIWFDPEQVDADTQAAIEDYMQSRQSMGFTNNQGGSVFASPYDAITPSGKAIALRLWGVAVDCAAWDPIVADSLLIDYWGSHGNAPEAFLSEYPVNALGYADEASSETPSDPANTGDEASSEAPSDEASPADDGTPADDGSPTDDGSPAEG